MRGEQLLMRLVIDEKPNASVKHVKGIYTDKRDDLLACRFFYYSNIHRRDYLYCLERLSEEFFLTEQVIIQRLTCRRDFIKDLKEKNTTIRDLRKIAPHISWEAPSFLVAQ